MTFVTLPCASPSSRSLGLSPGCPVQDRHATFPSGRVVKSWWQFDRPPTFLVLVRPSIDTRSTSPPSFVMLPTLSATIHMYCPSTLILARLHWLGAALHQTGSPSESRMNARPGVVPPPPNPPPMPMPELQIKKPFACGAVLVPALRVTRGTLLDTAPV